MSLSLKKSVLDTLESTSKKSTVIQCHPNLVFIQLQEDLIL